MNQRFKCLMKLLKEEEIIGKLKPWGGKGLSVIWSSEVIRENIDKFHDIKNTYKQIKLHNKAHSK